MIGPKLSDSLTDMAGVPAELLDEVIRLYRAYYVATGIAQSRMYPGVRESWSPSRRPGGPIAVATQKPEAPGPHGTGAPRHGRAVPQASTVPRMTRRSAGVPVGQDRDRGGRCGPLSDLGHAACRDGGGPGAGRCRCRRQRPGLHRRGLGIRPGRRTGRGGRGGDRAHRGTAWRTLIGRMRAAQRDRLAHERG